MAEVVLTIGDRRHTVGCRDGEEEQLRRLGTMLDAHWAVASRAAGGINAERIMLFVALMLADELEEADRRPPPVGAASADQLAQIAERLERLASALEEPVANA